MPIHCVVLGCKSRQDKKEIENGRTIAFHRFPLKNKQVSEKWENAVNKVNPEGGKWRAGAFSFVCSKHFSASDYANPLTDTNSQRRLRKGAVPSIDLGYKSTPTIPLTLEPEVRENLKRSLPDDLSMTLTKISRFHNYAKPHPTTWYTEIKDEVDYTTGPSLACVQTLLVSAETPSPAMKFVDDKKKTRLKVRTLQQKVRRQKTKIANLKRLLGRQCVNASQTTRFLSAISVPHTETQSTNTAEPTKKYPENIINIVNQISQLTLAETAELNELLKATLKIPDAPTMVMGSMAMAQSLDQDESMEEVKEEQTEFTIKLTGFDDGGKIKLIKEIKNLVEGMNLVQAKKFVESVPQILKENISKEEVDQLKAQIEAVGGTVEIE